MEIHTDENAFLILQSFQYKKVNMILEYDYDTEFLDMIMAVRSVDSADSAIMHIQKHSLGHSEVVVTENTATVQSFF